MLPVGRFPTCDYEEITVTLGKVGRLSLLIIVCLENQGDKRNKEQSELNQFFPCNHVHTPFLAIGGKEEHYPRRKSRGTAYRGTTDSTADSVPQELTNCKEKAVNVSAVCPIPMKIHQKGEEKSSPFSFPLAIRRQLCYTESRIPSQKNGKDD